MNTQPIEILEEIISRIPTHLLYNKCLINRTWYILVSRELQRQLNEIIKELYKYDQLLKEFGEKLYWANIYDDNDLIEKLLEQSTAYQDKYWELMSERLEIKTEMIKYGMLKEEDIYSESYDDDEIYY